MGARGVVADMSDVDQAFQQCPDCGRYLVKLGAHRCQTRSSSSPNREQRMRIAEADPRPDGDTVMVLPTRKVDGSYAYHEVTEAGTPRCGGGGSIDDDTWVTLPREKARERGRSPCMTCLRLTGDVEEATEAAAEAVTAGEPGGT